MPKRSHSTQEIHNYILDNLSRHPKDITRLTTEKFEISRPAVIRHINLLIRKGWVAAQGKTKAREYALCTIDQNIVEVPLDGHVEEDRVWREHIKPFLKDIAPNVLRICQYGFTEMMNNAIDHSSGTLATLSVSLDAATIRLLVLDDGVGIFQKIRKGLNLEEERHAILELSKGKLTTDPERHTGEGIFFTSRSFDFFSILSGTMFLAHVPNEDWLLEDDKNRVAGTSVTMTISPRSKRVLTGVFDEYASEHPDYGFTKTHVPVKLARFGDENLVSRSQARRLLARFNRFKEILLDFSDVDSIGQAFSDEIFRVFQCEHPEIHLQWINANEGIQLMINRTKTQDRG